MEIIATTKEGVLIKASNAEVREIMRSVTGKTPKELSIGDKIPAIDYASTITKLKELGENNSFTNLLYYTKDFVERVEELSKVVEAAKNLGV